MSKCAGYRRVGEAILNEHGIEPGATAGELPAPETFDDLRELLAVARVCPVVVRMLAVRPLATGDGRIVEPTRDTVSEIGWSGQSAKWGTECEDPGCDRCSLRRYDTEKLQQDAGRFADVSRRFRWVSPESSWFFKPHQHPEVER
jgi:hypothetical protein